MGFKYLYSYKYKCLLVYYIQGQNQLQVHFDMYFLEQIYILK